MNTRRWTRRFVIAGVWALAASTWGSIGHHLLGLPDVGALLPAMAAGAVLLWRVPVQKGIRKAPSAARAI